MTPVYANKIVGLGKASANKHGGGLCLDYLRYLTYLSSAINNWYRHIPLPPRAIPQRVAQHIAASLGYVDKTATSKAFSRLGRLNLSKLSVDGEEK